jgi:hypothetical protein
VIAETGHSLRRVLETLTQSEDRWEGQPVKLEAYGMLAAIAERATRQGRTGRVAS